MRRSTRQRWRSGPPTRRSGWTWIVLSASGGRRSTATRVGGESWAPTAATAATTSTTSCTQRGRLLSRPIRTRRRARFSSGLTRPWRMRAGMAGGLGWTMTSGDQMRHFVSSQTHALRNVAATRPGPERFGFAWPRTTPPGCREAEFLSQTDQLLDRLGTAIAESGSTGASTQGSTRASPRGFYWCGAVVPGASFTDAWRIFAREWSSDREAGLYPTLVNRERDAVTRARRGTRDARVPSPT